MLKDLKSDLKEGRLRGLYVFHGPEDYLKDHYVSEVRGRVADGDGTFGAMNVTVFEGVPEAGAFIAALQTVPFFAERRLVIVKDSGFFKAGAKGALDPIEALSAIPPTTVAVFVEGAIDKRLKSVSYAKKEGLLVEFGYCGVPELTVWVRNVLKPSGLRVSDAAAEALARIGLSGMYGLKGELEKVALYFSGRDAELGLRDVEGFCVRRLSDKVFDLVDLAVSGDMAGAYSILTDMLELRESPFKIMHLLGRQCRLILEMKGLAEEGVRPGGMASALGMQPFLVGKMERQAKRYGKKMAEGLVSDGFFLELAVKTGNMGERAALDAMIADIGRFAGR
ncbi:MAG: DNA polymerase III subunit delta [Oscillospiraceae bacterium]|nr:DNA polymerase III subunit delta [Oscillospiraceae bacterium]